MGSYLCRLPDTLARMLYMCVCVCAAAQCDMTGILLRELLLASPPQWQIASSIHIDNINISSNARNLHLPLGRPRARAAMGLLRRDQGKLHCEKLLKENFKEITLRYIKFQSIA